MMKSLKKIASLFLALCLAASVFVVPASAVEIKVKNAISVSGTVGALNKDIKVLFEIPEGLENISGIQFSVETPDDFPIVAAAGSVEGWEFYTQEGSDIYLMEVGAGEFDYLETVATPVDGKYEIATLTIQPSENAEAGIVPVAIHVFDIATNDGSEGNNHENTEDVAVPGEFTYSKEVHVCSHTSTVTKKPTCTEKGVETFSCICGDSYTKEIPATGHTKKTVKGYAATCTKEGRTDGVVCSVCGATVTAQKTIAKKAHTAVELKAKAATCTATGLTKGSKCSVCGKVLTAQQTVAKKAHSYKTTTTKATLKKNGKIVKKCTVCGKVASTTTIYYAKTVKLSKTKFTYTGKTIKPTLVVKNSKGKTISSKYYTVTGTRSTKKIGKFKITLKFKGNYSGTKTLYYTINPKTVASLKLKAGKKQMTVSYKKDSSVGGYEIVYATNKSFKKAKTTKATSAKKTIKKLTSKKTYYVKVRAYKKVSGKTYYGAYCKAKTVKVK